MLSNGKCCVFSVVLDCMVLFGKAATPWSYRRPPLRCAIDGPVFCAAASKPPAVRPFRRPSKPPDRCPRSRWTGPPGPRMVDRFCVPIRWADELGPFSWSSRSCRAGPEGIPVAIARQPNRSVSDQPKYKMNEKAVSRYQELLFTDMVLGCYTCSLSKNKLSRLNLSAVSSTSASGSLDAAACFSRLSTDSIVENSSLSGDSISSAAGVSSLYIWKSRTRSYFFKHNTYGWSINSSVPLTTTSKCVASVDSLPSLTRPVWRCSIRSKACSCISTFRWVIIRTKMRMSLAAQIYNMSYYSSMRKILI